MQMRLDNFKVAFAVAVVGACTLSAEQASAASWTPAHAASSGIAQRLLHPVACRRVPIWGWRISAFCKPSGVCNDRVIKGYRTVCS